MNLALPSFAAGLPRMAAEPLPGPIRQLSFAPLLELSLRQAGGPAARLLVREGQTVQRGELLAVADDPSSLPLHAPASGRLQRIVQRADGRGGVETRLLLAPWAGDTQEYRGPTRPAGARADAEALLAAVRQAGIAVDSEDDRSEPLAQRLHAAPQGGIVIVNAIEPEPPFRVHGALLRQQAQDLRRGLDAIRRTLAPEALLLAVDPLDVEAAAPLRDSGVLLKPLRAHYPQGDPRLLPGLLARARDPLAARLRREGALLLPLRSIAELGELLANGEAATSRLVAIAGPALREPGLYRVPLGTPLRHLLAEAGMADTRACVLQGGPFRGRPLAKLDLPIQLGHDSFMVLPANAVQADEREWPCLRCGDCVAACPVDLNPAELGLLARRAEYASMRDTQGLDACIECGACSWACPSRIPLLRRFRAAKAQLRRLAVPEPLQ